MRRTDPHSVQSSRRSAIRLLLGSGIIGAAWGSGFIALNSIRGPSATVAGADDWQLIVIESGRSRAAILMGSPGGPIGDTLSRMMGSFRQRIDIVIGAAEALKSLPTGYRSRWNVQRTILLSGQAAQSLSGETGSIVSPTLIDLGPRMSLSLTPVIRGKWKTEGESTTGRERWIVTAKANGATVRLAERLEDIAAMSLGPSAVTIAPGGDLRALWSIDPTSAIAVNTSHVPREVITSPESHAEDSHWLVAVFPSDFSHLAFVEGGVGLPDWARRIQFLTT